MLFSWKKATHNWLCDLPAEKTEMYKKISSSSSSHSDRLPPTVCCWRGRNRRRRRHQREEHIIRNCLSTCVSLCACQQKILSRRKITEVKKREKGEMVLVSAGKPGKKCSQSWTWPVSQTVQLKSGQSGWSGRLVETAIDFNFDLFQNLFLKSRQR